jgi:hypothetical protein
MKLSKQDRAKIAALDHHQLAAYKDERGQKLTPAAIGAEITRRVKEKLTPDHPRESPHVRRHREAKASRTLR